MTDKPKSRKKSGLGQETALPPEPARRKRAAIAIFIILLGCYGYFFYVWANWNVNTRLALTHAIVDEGRLEIDSYHSMTGDKARYRGHYYADKAVGASFLGVPFYWLYRQLAPPAPGSATERSLRAILGNYVISLFATAIPSALAGMLLFILLGYYTTRAAPRIWLTLAYGLGTLAFPYATMLFGHQTAAAFILIAFFLIFWTRRKGWSWAWLLLAGLLAGYSVITDFLAFVPVAGLVAYLAVCLWKENELSRKFRAVLFVVFIVAILLPLPLQLWYNWACFDDPFASGYQYEVIQKFREGMSQGLMGIGLPKLEALYQLTFGPRRGLFYGSPFLLFLFPGAYIMLKRKEFRAEGVLCIAAGLVSLLLNSGYYLWWGGAAYGARFMIVALPFLVLPAFFAYPVNPLSFKILAAGSIVFSFIVVTASPMIAEASPNPLYEGALRTLLDEIRDPGELINFNLMMYLEVDDLRSILPLIAFLIIGLMYLRSLRLP